MDNLSENQLMLAKSIDRLIGVMERTIIRVGKLEDSHLEIAQLVMKVKAIEDEKNG